MEWIFVCIIALLQLLDGVLTTLIIQNGGRELWGPQKWIQQKLGLIPGLILSRVVAVGLAAGVAYLVPTYHTLLVLLYFITMIFAVVCLSNLSTWGSTRGSGRA